MLENKTCVKSTEITVTLQEIKNPTEFGLLFSETWDDFMKNAQKYISIEIIDLDPTSFEYLVGISSENTHLIEITITYSVNVTKGTTILFFVEEPKDLVSMSKVYFDSFSGNTTVLEDIKICGNDEYFESGIKLNLFIN